MRDGDDDLGDSDQDCHRRERQLAGIAAQQLGVVTRAQLYELGFTYWQIRRKLGLGRLHRVHHNVYAVGHARLTSQACLVAGVLSVGPGSFLSHRTAAAVWGLRAVNVHRIELTRPGSGGRRHAGLIVHRTQTEPHLADVCVRGRLRVSSVARMLVELAPRETPAELARLVTAAVQKGLLALHRADARERLEATLARHARYPGMATLTAVLAAYRRPESSKSELERAFDRLIAQHPEIPDPHRNVEIDRWEIDRYWPEQNLAVELAGRPYHIAAGAMERDRLKDASLLRQGITPLRFTDFRVEHDLHGILGDLRHFLGLG
jgi:very-short-patch-repair endonuclease